MRIEDRAKPDVVFMEDQTIKDIKSQMEWIPNQQEEPEEVFHDARGEWQREEPASPAPEAQADRGSSR